MREWEGYGRGRYESKFIIIHILYEYVHVYIYVRMHARTYRRQFGMKLKVHRAAPVSGTPETHNRVPDVRRVCASQRMPAKREIVFKEANQRVLLST